MSTPDTQYERGLPANIDAERSILGAVLLENRAYQEAASILDPEDFALDSHQRLFACMGRLANAEPPRAIDIVTLTDALSRKKEVDAVGGVAYVFSLTEGLPRRLSIGEYVRIVKEKSLARQAIKIQAVGIERMHDQDEDARVVISEIEAQIQALGHTAATEGLIRAGDFLKTRFTTDAEVFKRPKGIRSGFDDYDSKTGGLFNGELSIVAARPSMGKSSWGMNMCEFSSIRDSKKVAAFILEEDKEVFLLKMACSRASVAFSDFQKNLVNELDKIEVRRALDEIKASHLYIDDSPALTPGQMRSRAMRLQDDVGLDLVVIDYLQLMEPNPNTAKKNQNREQEVAGIGRGLKAAARVLGVPVVVLAQLKRIDGRPKLSDLRESGSLEQDAHNVTFLFRESYYDPNNEELKGQGTAIIAKQRNGPICDVHLRYQGEILRWSDKPRQGEFYEGEF